MKIMIFSFSAEMNRYCLRQTSMSSVLFSVFFFFFVLSSFVLSQQPANQTATMITLYDLFRHTSSPWNITKEPNPCQWKGVYCSGPSITHLSLSGFGLSSYAFLPTACEISSLRSLDLSNNHFSSIPLEVFRNNCSGIIDGLQLLNFSNNSLAGTLTDFHFFVGLKHLDLSYNKLSGNVSLQLDELVNLKSLNLSHNRFSGFIPTNLGISKALENLTLAKLSSSSPESTNERKQVGVRVIIYIAAAAVVVGVVTAIALSISSCFGTVQVEQLQSREESHFPHFHQIIQGNILTKNVIHRSSINFTKAMDAVADPLNIVFKTRFSTYYKAIMPSGMSYFIKKLNWTKMVNQLPEHFEEELEVLGKLSNSNVMTPLAYVVAIDSAYLFYEYSPKGTYEYSPKGTLSEVLHGSQEYALDWVSLYSIAVGVTQGLSFLHQSNFGPILLFNLSSRTILLKSLQEPQVGDIEICKVIEPSRSTGYISTVVGFVGYIPPEYAYLMTMTAAANVYSFGVILLELLTGKPATSEGTKLAEWVIHVMAQQEMWDHILDSSVSQTSVAVRSQMLSVLKVVIACVNASPEARPDMEIVLQMLLNVS